MGRIGSPAQLLDSRLALRVEPGRITPASRIVNGTARYTDPLKSGTPRQLQPKYGLTTNGTNEFVELTYVLAAHTTATVLFAVNDLGSAAADRWVAVGGTALGIDVVWTSDGFDLIVGSDASNYTTYAYNGGALSGWHKVGVTVSGTTVAAYLDGVAVTLVPAATGTGFDGTLPATERVRIGADAADTAANHSNATLDNFEYYDVALSADDMAAKGAMKPGSTSGVTVSAVPLIHYKCEDPVTSATVKNSGSLGASANATITGTVANVRGTVSPVFCWANEVGYTEGTGSNGGAVGELIPRDESNPTKDIAGNDLQYVGQCPRDMVLTSPAVTLNGTNEYITLPVTLAGATSWEFSCRIKTTDTAGVIFDNRDGNTDGYAITLVAGAVVVASDAADVTGSTIDDDAWHTLRVVWDGADATIHIDDEVDVTGALAAASGIARTTSYIGADWTAAAGFLAGTVADVVVTKDGTVVSNNPMCELSGDIAFDISGNGNDGKLTGTIANMRAGTQNKSDVLVKSGYSVGRWYDGANDYWTKGSRLTSGSTPLSICFWARRERSATEVLLCEDNTSVRSWHIYVNSSGDIIWQLFDSSGDNRSCTTDVPVVDSTLRHFSFVLDEGAVTIKVDGVEQAYTEGGPAASIPNTIRDVAVPFAIGAYTTGSTPFQGVMSQIVIEQAAWSAEEESALRIAGKPSEVAAIRPNAWYFPDGSGSHEALQSLAALTHNGASEQRIIPVGAAGIQPTHGPGLLAPGQSLDLYCGQDDAPICQVLAGDLADGIYDFGDGDEADALYKRGDANGEEIAVITPAATGAEQTVLNAWST